MAYNTAKGMDRASLEKSGVVDMVTARVPKEIKRQGNACLKAIGATPTMLINAAYEYVISQKQLPAIEAAPVVAAFGEAPVVRTLDGDDLQALRQSIEASTLDIPETAWTNTDYKQIVAAGKRADYEALS